MIAISTLIYLRMYNKQLNNILHSYITLLLATAFNLIGENGGITDNFPQLSPFFLVDKALHMLCNILRLSTGLSEGPQ